MHALPAFLDVFTATLREQIEDVQILDGPPVDYLHNDLVAVGVTTEDATVESDTATAGLSARMESIVVVNLIRVWSGDTDMVPRRRRAYELLDGFDAVLQADPSVDGSVGRARVVSHVYNPVRTEKGAGVFLVPRIRIDAFPS